MRMLAGWLWLAFGGLVSACADGPPIPRQDDAEPSRAVHVLGNDWHTAIIVSRREVAAMGLIPEAEDLPNAVYLEFGWGDKEYYPSPEKTLGMTLKAALISTPAVIHMSGRASLPSAAIGESVRVPLTEDGHRGLVSAIAASFKRPNGDRAPPIARGLSADSNFYDARGKFHLFNTCNTWTARMMRAGGVDLSTTGVITADDLMTRLRAALASPAVRDPMKVQPRN